jgi:hypothetical protein
VTEASPALGLATKVALVATFLVMATFAVTYHRRQNRPGRLGGAISRAKAVWLSYAVYLWFFLCPLLALDPAVARPARLLLGAFAAFMWLRGVAELLLLYVFKRWQPPMGVGHDLACLLLLGGGAWWLGPELSVVARPLDGWVLGLLALVVVSLLCEVGFAWRFHVAVAGATHGDDGVWFASEDDPRFRAINLWTATLEAPQLVLLVVFLGVCLHDA